MYNDNYFHYKWTVLLYLYILYYFTLDAYITYRVHHVQSNLYIKATQGNLKMWPL